jgi:hypothetical protein
MRISVSPHLGPVRVTVWSWSSRRRPVRHRPRRPVILPVLWWAVLAEVWLCAEIAVFLASMVLVIIDLCRHQARFTDIRLAGLPRWGLFAFDVKGSN